MFRHTRECANPRIAIKIWHNQDGSASAAIGIPISILIITDKKQNVSIITINGKKTQDVKIEVKIKHRADGGNTDKLNRTKVIMKL